MQLAKKLQQQTPPPSTEAIDVPSTYMGFLAWMGITPRPGQAEFIRVAYDGALPLDRDLAKRIFGAIDFSAVSLGIRGVVASVCGGRAGKTYLLVALRLVWGMLVRDLSPLAIGEEAFATYVAPRDDLRAQILNYALGAVRSKPELRALMRLPKGTKATDTPSEFGIYRPDFDRVVTFRGSVASRGGTGVRGVWHTDLALDEAAFFRDASYKVNDEEIFKAGRPRVLAGGQLLVHSTPFARIGLLWDLYRENYGHPVTALVAQSATTVLNDDPYIADIVAQERIRDPDNAKHEYDAEFVEAGTLVFFDATSLESAETDESFTLEPGDFVAAGGDLAFRGDSSALVGVALRGETLHVFDGFELRPQDGPLSMEKTFADFVGKLTAWGCGSVMVDFHYIDALIEYLTKHKLNVLPAPSTPADSYVRARQLFRARRVKIHGVEFRRRLMQQLREVQGRPIAGGGMQIYHPRWAKGGHGDIAEALVLALWQLYSEEIAKPPPELGTPEWNQIAKAERAKRFQEEAQQTTKHPNRRMR